MAAGVAGAAMTCRSSDAKSAGATPSAPATTPATATEREAAITAHAPTASASAEVAALRAMDKALLDKLHEPLHAASQKDAFPQQAYRVNVYQEAGHDTPNRLEVDLNRNEKWDERWTVEGTHIKREVAPADDENFTRVYSLENGSWSAKR